MMYASRAFRTQYTPSGYSSPKAYFVFLTEEQDLETIDWNALTRAQSISNVSSLKSGAVFGALVKDSYLWGTYVPTVGLTQITIGSKMKVESRTASATNTFRSKLDAPPVQCLVMIASDTSNITNNIGAGGLSNSTDTVSNVSFMTCSVGLRDSGAEIILLADEFKKDQEYRISDFSLEYDIFGEQL